MSNFMALLGLAIGGFAVSFMLVFNIATTDVGNRVVNQTSPDKITKEDVMSVITIGNTLDGDVVDEDVVQFGNLPVSFFRCVTRCCPMLLSPSPPVPFLAFATFLILSPDTAHCRQVLHDHTRRLRRRGVVRAWVRSHVGLHHGGAFRQRGDAEPANRDRAALHAAACTIVVPLQQHAMTVAASTSVLTLEAWL